MAVKILNPDAARRLEGPDRLASDLLVDALELPDPSALERLNKSAATLHHVDPSKISGEDTRTAFWINVYNALRLLVFHVDPPKTSVPLSLSRFRGYAWRIGGHDYTLSVIHHALLRANRRPLWTLRPLLRDGDPRLAAAPSLFDPRIHFALAFGAESAPHARRFLSGMLDKQLRDAEREYVAAHTEIDERRAIVVPPGLVRAYRADFGLTTKPSVLDWLAKRLPDDRARWLHENRARITMPWRLLALRWAFPPSGWRK